MENTYKANETAPYSAKPQVHTLTPYSGQPKKNTAMDTIYSGRQDELFPESMYQSIMPLGQLYMVKGQNGQVGLLYVMPQGALEQFLDMYRSTVTDAPSVFDRFDVLYNGDKDAKAPYKKPAKVVDMDKLMSNGGLEAKLDKAA
ncbi:MAG: hypothetical protein ACMXYC_01780 [Candidatus Woesearchaeota archaeon]